MTGGGWLYINDIYILQYHMLCAMCLMFIYTPVPYIYSIHLYRFFFFNLNQQNNYTYFIYYAIIKITVALSALRVPRGAAVSRISP